MKKKHWLYILIVLCVISLAIAAYFIFNEIVVTEPHLIYVFEVVRHGARSPLIHAEGFPEPPEMLTPQGMR